MLLFIGKYPEVFPESPYWSAPRIPSVFKSVQTLELSWKQSSHKLQSQIRSKRVDKRTKNQYNRKLSCPNFWNQHPNSLSCHQRTTKWSWTKIDPRYYVETRSPIPTTANEPPLASSTDSEPEQTDNDNAIELSDAYPEATPSRTSIPRAAKDKCNSALVQNRHALSAIAPSDSPNSPTLEDLSNIFDKLVSIISDQSETVENIFDTNKYNFDSSDLSDSLNGKEQEFALIIHQEQELDNPDSSILSQTLQEPNV